MSDLNWCTYCDNAVNPFSESLYCSEQCLRADALRNHPLLGYTYPEFVDFPRANTTTTTAASAAIPIPYTRQHFSSTSNADSCSSSIKSCSTVPSLSAASTSTSTSATTTATTPHQSEKTDHVDATNTSPYLTNTSNNKSNINAFATTSITKTNAVGLFNNNSPTTKITTHHILTPYFI